MQHNAPDKAQADEGEQGCEQEKRFLAAQRQRAGGKVRLDVGGCHFTTSLTTLTSEPGSMLAAMFSGRHELEKDDEGRVFIDRDPKAFGVILDWLRNGHLPTALLNPKRAVRAGAVQPAVELEALVLEATYYGLTRLVAHLASGGVAEEDDSEDEGDREEFIRITEDQLVRLVNAGRPPQLSRCDLRHFCLSGMLLSEARFFRCNLRGVNLRWAILNSASFVECDLRGADLTGVQMESANLFSSNLRRSNLTGANLHWANLHHVDLSGAVVAKANLKEAKKMLSIKHSGVDWKAAYNLPRDFRHA